MIRSTASLFVVLTLAPLAVADEPKPAATDPKLVKLAELDAAIAAHKGKIVVVDFWADF
jgi:thiol:disulfide interchange protein